ncbi:MAG TPA: hypothetical protein VFP44_20120 [Usitatibacter sp.]|nr:hypothetical protein [Usitatibacter sp.]
MAFVTILADPVARQLQEFDMGHAHTPSTAFIARAPRSIRYEDWSHRIQTATDLDQLTAAVAAYLAQWRPQELAMLPVEVSAGVLDSSEEIPSRAVVAARAELKVDVDAPSAPFLRDMALTMMAAATRLRFLTALRARERGR